MDATGVEQVSAPKKVKRGRPAGKSKRAKKPAIKRKKATKHSAEVFTGADGAMVVLVR